MGHHNASFHPFHVMLVSLHAHTEIKAASPNAFDQLENHGRVLVELLNAIMSCKHKQGP